MHLDLRKKESNLMYVDMKLPCFVGVAGRNCNTINYMQAKDKIRRYEKHLLFFETGIAPEKVFFLDQEHGDVVVEAEKSYYLENMFFAKGDAMITNIPGNCLAIRTADCVPLFIIDEKNKALGAIHSGWKSTEKNIAAKTISKMKDKYGSDPSAMKAFILPAIGAEHYEVKEDVASKFTPFVKDCGGKLFLDIRAAVYQQLRSEGLKRENIFAAWQDTFSVNDLFFSHRKGDLGRNINFAYLY